MTDQQKAKTMEMRNAGYGYTEIARELSVSRETVKSFCRRKSIAVGSSVRRLPKLSDGLCPECGKSLVQIPGKKRKRFCSPDCRQAWWNKHPDQVGKKAFYQYICPTCGKAFSAYGNSSRKYCSHQCYVAARYKGGE